MKYIKISILLQLKRDYDKFETLQMISTNINTTLCKSLTTLHYESGFKGYVFSNLIPADKSVKGYKKDNKYWLEIRVMPKVFDEHFKEFGNNIPKKDFEILQYKYTTVDFKEVSKIYSLNPVLIRMDKKNNWVYQNGINEAVQRINTNLRNKYKEFFGKDIPESCNIGTFSLTNNKPIKIPYKNIHYLTNKFDIDIGNTPFAQELAFIAIATGLGEGNSYLGLGFCNAK